MSERYCHKDGFLDSTKYILIEDNGTPYLISHNGSPFISWLYDKDYCERKVEEGEWVKIKNPEHC